MKRIQHRPIRNISLRLQEEERERRLDFVPDRSAIDLDTIEIDKDTHDMLESLNVPNLLEAQLVAVRDPQQDNNRNNNRGPRRN
jgi:small subunit ribosomal protein S17e